MTQILSIISAIVLVFTLSATAQDVSIGERYSLESKTLNETREYLIHLPESYHHNPNISYPVLYLLDGDYNFRYVAGLLDQMSSISGQIPEMILVGIADKGTNKYRYNMRPVLELDPMNPKSGNATAFALFLKNELKAEIEKKFRTLPYSILTGHSVGGLFTVNTLLKSPSFFEAYIAISPALWINDKLIVQEADSILKSSLEMDKELYISLADETQMGVYDFVDVLDFHSPPKFKFKFEQYPKESHNSVGMVSIKDGLRYFFQDWEINREKFKTFENFKDVSMHYQKYQNKLGGETLIPELVIGNMMSAYTRENKMDEIAVMETEIADYFPSSLTSFYNVKALYQLAAEEMEMAQKTYEDNLKKYPESYKLNQGLSKVYLAQGKNEESKTYMQKAIDLAKKQNVSQWMLNILMAEQAGIK